MIHRKAFDSYRLYYVTNHATVPAQLLLYDGNTFVGWVYFYHDDIELPEPTWSDWFIVPFHRREFPTIMDILREEKPLFMLYNDSAKYAGIGTTEKEPIGDHERESLGRVLVSPLG